MDLAAGKGVLVTNKLEEAKKWVKEVMEDSKFGVAGKIFLLKNVYLVLSLVLWVY